MDVVTVEMLQTWDSVLGGCSPRGRADPDQALPLTDRQGCCTGTPCQLLASRHLHAHPITVNTEPNGTGGKQHVELVLCTAEPGGRRFTCELRV